MKLVVIIPALNEEKTIGDVLSRLPENLAGIDELISIVVDDGSTDRTAELARGAGAIVLSHPSKRGVGSAFHTGKTHAMALGADVAVNIDADGQFDPADIARIVAPILENKADFVTATRFGDPCLVPEMPSLKLWGNRMMCRLVNALARTRFTDVSCGFRAYSREALLHLNLFGSFTYTQEVILSLSLSGLGMAEVPVRVRGEREFGKSRVAGNLFKYAVQTSKIILRTYRDYRPWRFFFGLSMLCLAPGFVLTIFLGVHYALTGHVTPHKWAAFMAGLFYIMALQFGMTGIMADMNTRIRSTVEEILVNQRRSALRSGSEKGK